MNKETKITKLALFLERDTKINSAVLWGLVVSLFVSMNTLVAQNTRPNIVVIYTDDQGYGDLGAFGSTQAITPNIDKMAAEGITLKSFYNAADICTPSRAALLTGSYPRRIDMATGTVSGVLLAADTKGLHPDEITIAEVLQSSGYRTGMFGKWHLGDQPDFLPTRQGFDEFFGLPYSHDVHPFNPNNDRFDFPPLPLLEGEQVIELEPNADFLTQRFTERAVQFIEENSDNPFFLYVPHPIPHRPLHMTAPYLEGVSQDILDALNAEEANNTIDYLARDKLYYEALQEIDWSVGQILQALEQQGIDENTIVVFSSDNGPSRFTGSAGALRGAKGTTWEGGFRAPTVIRWPAQIPANTSSDEMLTTMDLFPTFANLADTTVPTDRVIDGKDILPVLTQGGASPHDAFFYYRQNTLQGVRSGQWKYRMGALYDLENDIGETTNVAAQYPEIVAELEAQMVTFEEELSANSRSAGFEEEPVALNFESTAVTTTVQDSLVFSNYASSENGVLELTETAIEISPVTLSGDFTIEAWVKFAAGQEITNADILVQGSNNNINFHEGRFRIWDGSLKKSLRDQVIADHNSVTGEWTHYAVTREAGVSRIFVNGALNATATRIWDNAFTIESIGNGLNGLVDDMLIWDTARNGDEILLDMDRRNAETSSLVDDPDLLRHYRFDFTESLFVVDEQPIEVEPITLSGDFTIQSWVYFNEGAKIDNSDGIIGSTAGDLNFHDGLLRLHSRSLGTGISGDIVIATNKASTSVWTHYAVVRRNGNVFLLIDGVLNQQTTDTWTEDFTISHLGTGIGGLDDGTGLSGRLRDLRIYGYARSQAEVNTDMAADVISDTIILDETGNSANMDIPSGATIIKDEDSEDLDSDLTAETFVRALHANGNGISVDEVTFSEDFTISTWVYFDPSQPLSNEDQLISGDGVNIHFTNGVFSFYVDGLGEFAQATVSSEEAIWTHFSVTREAGIVRLYINGVLNNSSAVGAGNRTVATLWTDAVTFTELAKLDGVVDDFQLWNTARSLVQIQSDLQGDVALDLEGLVRYYTFDGRSADIMDDTENTTNVILPEEAFFTDFSAPFEVFSDDPLTDSQVAADMTLPLDLAFLPDGRMIVVEKGGLVHIFEDPTTIGSARGTYLDISAITDNDSERGLLAVEVDPEFETNGYVYMYHTVLNLDNTVQKAVARYTHIEEGGGISSRLDEATRTIIWQEVPVALNRASNTHHGGGLAIAHEPINANDPSPYKLYIVTSDESDPGSSADLSSDNGKVHRVNLADGSIPLDNPYYDATAAANYRPELDASSSISSDGILTTIHSQGVRNGWRASYDQASNSLLFGEVGSTLFEDVHFAVAGADYGWPTEEGPLADPDDPGNPILSYTSRGGPGRDDLEDTPETANGSVTGGVVYRGTDLPEEYQNAYFYGDWGRNWIRYAKMDFSSDRPVVTDDLFFQNTNGRVLSFEQGPDGGLYYIITFQTDDVFSFEGAVNRIIFDDSNKAPSGKGIVVSDEERIAIEVPHTVNFVSHVVDPEDDEITYAWTFGDGSTSTEKNPSHTYVDAGDFEVNLTVTDSSGGVREYNAVTIQIGNAPVITIQTPTDGDTYRAGDEINVDGFAVDVEDGRFNETDKLMWTSSYGTDGLARPGPFEATADRNGGITFTTPNYGNVEYFLNSVTLIATATDSDGLSSTKSVTLFAKMSSITMDVPNEFVTVAIDGHITEPGSYVFEGVINFLFDLEADASYEEDGLTYVFSHWSDDPSNTDPLRQLAMPEKPTTIEPVYMEDTGEIATDGTLVFNFETGDLQGGAITDGEFGEIVTDKALFNSTGEAYNKEGNYFLSTLEPNKSDNFTGTVTSPLFMLDGGDASFLIGGGSDESLYFRLLLQNGTEIFRTNRGSNSEPLELRSIDLSDHIGEAMYWEVGDYSTSGWGYIAVDDIRFDATLIDEDENTLVFNFETGDLQGGAITDGEFGEIVTDKVLFNSTGEAYNKEGNYFLSTLEPNKSDNFTGTVTSPLFMLDGGDASFLIGGGSDENLYFRLLLQNGTEIFRTNRGSNSEPLELRSIDLSDHIGEAMYWEVGDYSTSGWGYIAVDDIRFQAHMLEATSLRANTDFPYTMDKQQMSIYPNPSDGLIHINLGDAFISDGTVNIMIFDLSGRLQKSKMIFKDTGFYAFTWDTSETGMSLATGTYVMVLQSMELSSSLQLIIE